MLSGTADTEALYTTVPAGYAGPFCEGIKDAYTLTADGFSAPQQRLQPGEWSYLLVKVASNFQPDVNLKMRWEVTSTSESSGRSAHLYMTGEPSDW